MGKVNTYIEARDKYIAEMRAEGFEPDFPADNELQIDIDTQEQYAAFVKNIDIMSRKLADWLGAMPTFRTNVSPSGLPHRHIRVTLPISVTELERIAWQAALGSDPTRELLSLFRLRQGITNPTLFMEPAKVAVAA